MCSAASTGKLEETETNVVAVRPQRAILEYDGAMLIATACVLEDYLTREERLEASISEFALST